MLLLPQKVEQMFNTQKIRLARKTHYLILFINVFLFLRVFEVAYSQAKTSQDSLLELLKQDALSAFFQKKYQTAIRKWQQFLVLDKQRKDTTEIAQIYINLGLSYSKISDFTKAFDSYTQAQSIYEKYGYTIGVFQSLRYVASLYFQIADYRTALTKYLKALKIIKDSSGSTFQAFIITAIGNTCLKLNNYDKARGYFYQALQIKRNRGSLRGQGQISSQLGVLNFYEGNLDSAFIHFKNSIEIQEKLKDHTGLRTSYLNLGYVYYIRDQLSSAMTQFKKALASQKAVEDLASQPTTLLKISDVAYRRNQFVQALSWCDQALNKAKQLGNPLDQAECLRKMGLIKFSQNQSSEAFKYMDNALTLALEANSAELIWKIYLGLGLIKEAQNLFFEASGYFKHAIGYIELTTFKRSLFREPQGFIHNKIDTYFKAINALLELNTKSPNADYLQQAFEMSERLSARRIHNSLFYLFPKDSDPDIRDKIALIKGLQSRKEAFENMLLKERIKPILDQNAWKTLSLRNYITKTNKIIRRYQNIVFKTRPDYRLLFVTPSAMLDSIQSHLRSDQVLIKYQILPEKLLIFLITPSQIKHKVIQLTKSNILNLLREFRSELSLAIEPAYLTSESKKERATQLAKLIRKFSDYLLPFILNETTPEQELLILPDQFLSFFPFPVLLAYLSGDKATYLIEKRLIRLFNSGTHFLSAKYFNFKNLDNALIIASNKSYSVDTWNEPEAIASELKKSAIEIDILNKNIPDSSSKAYSLIHLELAGEWDGEFIQKSYFELGVQNNSGNLQRIFLPDWFRIRTSDSALIFLTAFNAFLSEKYSDQSLLSLIECWKIMKAASIVVSLWETPSESRRLLVTEFYNRLHTGLSPAQALRIAQLSLIKSKQFSAPFYWAGFQLYGY